MKAPRPMNAKVPMSALLVAAALALGACGSSEDKTLAELKRDSREGNFASAYEKSRKVLDSPKGFSEKARKEAEQSYELASKRLVETYTSSILQMVRNGDYAGAISMYNQAVAEVPETSASPDLNRRIAAAYANMKDWSEARAALARLGDASDENYREESRQLLERLDEYERLTSEIDGLRDNVSAVGSAMGVDFGAKQDNPDCQMAQAISSLPEDQRADVERFFSLIQERNNAAADLQEVPGLPVIAMGT